MVVTKMTRRPLLQGRNLPRPRAKTVRFADAPRHLVDGGPHRSAPQANLDRTRPILYQPPLGVTTCVVSPRPGSVGAGPPSPVSNSDLPRVYQPQLSTNQTAVVSNSPPPLQYYHRPPKALEPSRQDSEYSFDSPRTEQLNSEEEDDEDIPPYYRPRVPSPLSPGYFRDPVTRQLYTRETYHPDGEVNACEVRTFEINSTPSPDNSPIHTFHPGRFTPVNNFADFENYKKSRQKASPPTSSNSTATSPHEPELGRRSYPVERDIRKDRPPDTMATIATAPNAVARLQERNDLAQLNDRLSHYITEVKHLREQAHRVDSTAFLESIKILEDGLYNLKNMYEHELDKARRYSDDLAQEKNHYAMQVSKHQNGLQELENRLADEMEKNRKAQDDMNVLHRSVAEKERQLEDIRHEVKEPLEELELLRRQYTDLLRENNNLKRKSETENYQRSEAEDKSDQMHKKMEFMETVHKQESQDLNDRLNVAQESILALEQRVRDLTRPDNLLEELVQRVRNSADHEMTMFREESEELFQRTVTALKARIDEDARRLEQLTGQNVQLTSEAGEMLSQIRALEGQVGSLDHQRRSLEEILYNERQHARSHITGLERKLQDLNDLLILKLRELNLARDAQVPLKSEVEALRVLLEEEERRLRNLPEISCGLNMPRTLQPLTTTTQTACTTAQAVPTTPLTASAYAAGVNIPNPTALGRRAPTQPQPPLGPVRARSAPVATPKLNLIPSTLGQGKDYFDQMFNDLRRDVIRSRQAFSADPPAGTASNANGGTSPFERPGNPEPGRAAPVSDRPPSSTTHDYNTSSCSATGPIRILEVQPDGKYVRMINTATTKDEEFGNFLLQQNVGGQPVAVYRFPPRLRFPAGATITVWSGSNDLMMHQPPSDYVFKEQTKWGTGPECTTILCKPSGQAVAWTTAAHRFSRDAFDQLSLNMTTDNTGSKADIMKCQEELPELSQEVNGPRAESVYLRREKEQPPCLSAQKHPHGVTPPSATHPNSAQARALSYGNDNSTVNRQSRSQTSVPDPIPGAPYAGASAQRMGSASLRKYSGTIKGNGHIANKKEAARPGTTTSRPPSSFQTPRDRFSAGLQQIQSQHNEAFTPPMPRPPLFSAW